MSKRDLLIQGFQVPLQQLFEKRKRDPLIWVKVTYQYMSKRDLLMQIVTCAHSAAHISRSLLPITYQKRPTTCDMCPSSSCSRQATHRKRPFISRSVLLTNSSHLLNSPIAFIYSTHSGAPPAAVQGNTPKEAKCLRVRHLEPLRC